ncbi:MAG: hypothetical protein HC913_08410 [Microscillaceae bacterium]|nr:hypothetical protein [Microscillaceae bacterium]
MPFCREVGNQALCKGTTSQKAFGIAQGTKSFQITDVAVVRQWQVEVQGFVKFRQLGHWKTNFTDREQALGAKSLFAVISQVVPGDELEYIAGRVLKIQSVGIPVWKIHHFFFQKRA